MRDGGGREGEREGRERGVDGGERDRGKERKFIFINHLVRSIQLFSSSILPQLQDGASLLFLIIYMKKLFSSGWLR